MHSDDLRPVGPRTWALLSGEARAALDAYDIKPAPFELEGQEPTAVILNWNDPAQSREKDRARAEKYRREKAPMTRIVRAAPAAAPLSTPRRFSPPRNEHLAKQLAGLSSMSASKIAAFCNLPVDEVEAMRASREQGT